MRNIVLALAAGMLIVQPALAQGPLRSEPMAAPAEPGALPLYGAQTMGTPSSEIWMKMGGNVSVRNVTRPTITPVLPARGKATGAAVVIMPGGGLVQLSMDSEGWKTARAFADRGIAAFVVKYRTIPTPVSEAEYGQAVIKLMMPAMRDPSKQPALGHPAAADDGLAGIKYVRDNAARLGVDPQKVGLIGFSAGAQAALDAALKAAPGAGPDFLGYIYGPQATIEVPATAPPMFDAIALDDNIFPWQGFPIVQAWRKAKRPVEVHGYERGGHGFATGQAGSTTSLVLDQFTAWLAMHGFLPNPTKSTRK